MTSRPRTPPHKEDDLLDNSEDCSSLTSSSTDTFHVFTDGSVSLTEKKKKQSSSSLPYIERERIKSERQKLEEERQKLAEERKKLEEERQRLRLGDKEYKKLQEKKESARRNLKIRSLSNERLQLEQEEKVRKRMERLEAKNREKEKAEIKSMTDLDASEHMISDNFRNLRRISRDAEELQALNDELDNMGSNHFDNTSIDLEQEAEKAEQERKEKEAEIKRLEEETRRKILEKARKKVQQERKQRQEMIRKRIAAEEAEAKRKKNEKEKAEAKKQQDVKKAANTEKARMERAYGWYTKLAMPKRSVMKKKISLIKSIDVSEDDVDLLPWNASGTMVNVAKLNSMLYTR